MARLRMGLDGLWDFFPDPERILEQNTLDKAGTPRRIHVPGPWQAQFDDLRTYSGVAWYRLPLMLSTELAAVSPQDSLFILHVGAADYHTTVWLNGIKVGEHEGGYLPFEVVLNDAMQRDGDNELVVRVIDLGDDEEGFPEFTFSEVPHGKQSWYGPVGGIWQSVYIEVRNPTHIDQLHVTPLVERSEAQVDLRLNRAARQNLSLVLRVRDPKGMTTEHHALIAAGENTGRATVPIPDALLWDTEHPYLYSCTAELRTESTPVVQDTTEARFGMRSIAASPQGHLMLNGQILYLRGALDQDYYPDLIYTPFSDSELDAQFARAKHMGLNCLRTHIKITDPRYYDAADRAGILIWTELPNWINLTPAVKVRARETLEGMVERDWNHPSIVIWTIVNEGWGVDLAANADHRAWLAETYDYLKKLDGYRLVVGNSACFTNFHVVTDIEDFHNYYAMPDHYDQWRTWVQTFAGRAPWTFAHSYENITAWREFVHDPWNPRARPAAPEVRRTGNEPMVVSEFGNWGLPDPALLRRAYNGQDPWWFETGLEWGDGAVYPHGVEQRFKAWHLDKVFGSYQNLVTASQRMQYGALKYQIEQMRRYASIVGYVITEFTDVHWECNGLLDMARNPKSFYDRFGEINSDDAIVPDWGERIAYWEGERCEVRLTVSHFSNLDLNNCRLVWELDDYPGVRGDFTELKPGRAAATAIGTVAFDAPPVTQGMRARLQFRLYDQHGRKITGNHLELYFFPRAQGSAPRYRISSAPRLARSLKQLGYTLTPDLDEADIALTTVMTDELRQFVQGGGKVVWLAESSDSQQTYLGIDVVPRRGRQWQGDWASNMNWLRQDRMFAAIPTEHTVDFAFADLTPEHVITGLKPREYANDVHAGLFVGWLHHCVALVAERRLGMGRLLVSTFRLQNHLLRHPIATIMLRDMLNHIFRDTHEPGQTQRLPQTTVT